MKEWIQKWEVKGTSGKTYEVSKASDGSFGCTCQAWIYQRKVNGPRKECQHILRKRLELNDMTGVRKDVQSVEAQPEFIRKVSFDK